MKFRDLIFKNISRNKSRSLLVIFGIAIGVAAVMGVGLLTDGLAQSTQNALTTGVADFSVISDAGEGGNGPDGSGGSGGGMGRQELINESFTSQIQQISGVSRAVGVLRTMTDLTNSSTNTSSSDTSSSGRNFRSMTTLIGIDSSSVNMNDIVVTNGSVYYNGANEVILGARAAKSSGKTLGDNITIFNETFKVVGIFETGNFQDDNGVVMSLSKLQNLTNSTGKVSLILVKVENGTDTNKLATTIGNKYPDELTTSTSLSGMERMNQGLGVISTGAWAISLVAILVGAIIVLITMMKAVSERTREIGVLRAIGWTRQKIMKMIIGESLLLSLVGLVVGLVVGVGLIEVMSITHLMPGIRPSYSVLLFVKGIVVAILLAIVGGLYPAYMASRLKPTEALRYE